MHPCGAFFIKYVGWVGFKPPKQGGSVQGLGRRQYADLRETQKSAANEAKRNKSISRNHRFFRKWRNCTIF